MARTQIILGESVEGNAINPHFPAYVALIPWITILEAAYMLTLNSVTFPTLDEMMKLALSFRQEKKPHVDEASKKGMVSVGCKKKVFGYLCEGLSPTGDSDSVRRRYGLRPSSRFQRNRNLGITIHALALLWSFQWTDSAPRKVISKVSEPLMRMRLTRTCWTTRRREP